MRSDKGVSMIALIAAALAFTTQSIGTPQPIQQSPAPSESVGSSASIGVEPAVARPPISDSDATRRSAEFQGRATVIDGDTLDVGGQRVRLWGVDAPEIGQTCERGGRTGQCGEESALALAAFIQATGGVVSCFPRGRPDRYGRTVAACSVSVPWPEGAGPSPADLGAHQVLNGQALDSPRYSQGAYAGFEEQARERRAGVWAGTFVRPWDWRGQ